MKPLNLGAIGRRFLPSLWKMFANNFFWLYKVCAWRTLVILALVIQSLLVDQVGYKISLVIETLLHMWCILRGTINQIRVTLVRIVVFFFAYCGFITSTWNQRPGKNVTDFYNIINQPILDITVAYELLKSSDDRPTQSTGDNSSDSFYICISTKGNIKRPSKFVKCKNTEPL